METPSANKQPDQLSSWWALGNAEHLFGRIRRYTCFVAFGKWSLLAVALVLTASLIIWPLLSADKSGLRVSFNSTPEAGKKAANPVMTNPEYRGVGAQGQEYKISGKTATQQTPTLVVMQTVEAQMTKADGTWHAITADRAEFQQDKKIIDLFGHVTLIDAKGSSFTTERATIEISPLHIYGSEAISGVSSSGNILASGFEIVDDGARIVFTRGAAPVKVNFERKPVNP
jgi:lipopolysaccharide export system protein LptC